MKTFQTSLKVGDIGESAIKLYLQSMQDTGKIDSWDRTSHLMYRAKNLPYETDFIIVNKDGEEVYLEVKTIAGCSEKNGIRSPFPTTPIEVWADTSMTKRPGWYRTAEQVEDRTMIVFLNRYDNCFYFHDSKDVKDFVDNASRLTRANDGNANNPGLITLMPWENASSFCFKVDATEYLQDVQAYYRLKEIMEKEDL